MTGRISNQMLELNTSNLPVALNTFIPGLQLSHIFYTEAVQPILARRFPQLRYSAGLLGSGSDVQCFDTAQSMDHDWGPRLLLFLLDEDHAVYHEQLDVILRSELPLEIRGFPTNFAVQESGTRWMQPLSIGPLNHGVKIVPHRAFFADYLKRDPDQVMHVIDWLTVPGQIFREVTGGEIFHDDLDLRIFRERIHYYPHNVWLYLLSAQWTHIGQEAPFAGRCAQVGNELGSRIVATRLVRDIMWLCFLLEKQHVPYIKWFGTAFERLKIAPRLSPILLDALSAANWSEREQQLCAAYEIIAQAHNALNITQPGPTQVSSFHDRPFKVIQAEAFANLTRAAITDPQVLALPPHIGASDQFVDSTDVLSNPVFIDRLKAMFA